MSLPVDDIGSPKGAGRGDSLIENSGAGQPSAPRRTIAGNWPRRPEPLLSRCQFGARSDRMRPMPIANLEEIARGLAESGQRVSVLWQEPDSLAFVARGRE